MLTKHTLFRPTMPRAKSDRTTEIANGIVGAQTTARQEKTARLRRARLERDASDMAQKPAAAPEKRRKKPAVKTASAI